MVSASEKISQTKKNFIDFCQKNDALIFGEFITKAGRQSPHFFNFGQFFSGKAIDMLGTYYAQKILLIKEPFDVIFGPAYKGIALSVIASVSLNRLGVDTLFCYNRKEKKDHGEGSVLIGAPLAGKRVLIIDDVLSSGLSTITSKKIIEEQGGTVSGLVVGIDREEKYCDGNMLARDHLILQNVPFHSIISLTDIIQYVKKVPSLQIYAEKMVQYRKENGFSEVELS